MRSAFLPLCSLCRHKTLFPPHPNCRRHSDRPKGRRCHRCNFRSDRFRSNNWKTGPHSFCVDTPRCSKWRMYPEMVLSSISICSRLLLSQARLPDCLNPASYTCFIFVGIFPQPVTTQFSASSRLAFDEGRQTVGALCSFSRDQEWRAHRLRTTH